MGNWLLYLSESAVCLLFFGWFYWLFLEKETFFRINRYYILSSIVLSFCIPFADFVYDISTANPLVLYNVLDTVIVTTSIIEHSFLEPASWHPLMFYIWILGAFIFSTIFLYRITLLVRLLKKSKIVRNSDHTLVLIPKDFTPFTFFRFVFINQNIIPEKELENILIHEHAHIRQWHSMDVVFIELVTIIQWFNPVAWLLKNKIREVHEFLADREVIQLGAEPLYYQQLIVKQAVGPDLLLASHFKNSMIKRRILMISKLKSPRAAWLKIVLLTPVLGLMVLAFSCNRKPNEPVINKVELASGPKVEGEVFMKVDQMPVFPGGENALIMYLSKAIKYPEKAKELGVTGKIFIHFVVTNTGKVADVKLAKGISETYDKTKPNDREKALYEASLLLEVTAMEVVALMPDWTPGENQGKKVNIEFTIPITFKLQ